MYASALRTLNALWQEPPGLPRALKLEWRLIAVRWVGIMFVAPALLLANLPAERFLAAYGVLAVAALYNLAVQHLIQRRPRLFVSGYLTTFADALLDIAMVSAGGGFDSPFYYILFTVTMSAAMRYGYGPSLAMALTFVGFDAASHLVSQQTPGSAFTFRSGFLCITPILASFLRERANRAEAALQERLRQAHLLNEATAALGASLDLEAVLHAVAAGAAHLFGSPALVLTSSAGWNGEPESAPLLVHHPAPSARHAELEALCAHSADQAGPGRSALSSAALPSGRMALVLALTSPSRSEPLATIALALPDGERSPALDRDILDSFVERVTLAIENATLYRTLALRTSDLQRAYADLAVAHQELLSVDEMKTNFLANVSHELRTPLTSIRSFSELLLSYDDPAVREEFLRIINSESERLTRLVNDVLDITRIESGHMDWHLTTIDLAALLSDAARAYTPLVEQRGLAFHVAIADDLPPIAGDRDRLQQVISNLLDNALKFTPAGSISLRASRLGEEIVVAVTDTGVGIAPEDHARIFEKFQQVGSTLTSKPHGTGLGLAICRDIVEFHHGRIWVESAPGAGSTFTFALPAPPAPGDAPTPPNGRYALAAA